MKGNQGKRKEGGGAAKAKDKGPSPQAGSKNAVPVEYRNELGTTGLKSWGWELDEEFLPELRGKRARKVYREMALNDPVIGAMLFAIDKLIRQVRWFALPESDSPRSGDAVDLLEQAMATMSPGWTAFISEALSYLEQGFSLFEEVYQVVDGRVLWRKLAFRPQETIQRWEFDEHGQVIAAIQVAPPRYETVRLPMEKCTLFRTTARKGNPEGLSVLRNAFRPWHFKKRIEEIEGIGIERDLTGLPILYVPPELLSADATETERAAFESAKDVIRRLRRNSQEGVILPSTYDSVTKEPLWKLTLLTTGGRRQFDTSAIIERYNRQIAMVVLADFILLGHEKVGSFALADAKTDIFAMAMNAWLDSMAEVLNRGAVARLMRFNGFAPGEGAIVEHGDIDERDLEALGSYVSKLVQAGVIVPDPELESYLRRAARLPEPAER